MIPQVLVVGGGMITHDQLLPSLLHLRHLGVVGDVDVVSQRPATISTLRQAFPGREFATHSGGGPDLYKQRIALMPAGNIVMVALPDQLHYEAVMTAIDHGQHVLCVKPLVLTAKESIAIEEAARKRNLVVGVEYHKRFDDRSLMARRRYRAGMFRGVQAWYRQPDGEVVLPPLKFPELAHHGELRCLHVHRMPLRRSRAFHHGAPARSR